MRIENEKRLFKILEYPKHLQTTIGALLKLGGAITEEVADATSRKVMVAAR